VTVPSRSAIACAILAAALVTIATTGWAAARAGHAGTALHAEAGL